MNGQLDERRARVGLVSSSVGSVRDVRKGDKELALTCSHGRGARLQHTDNHPTVEHVLAHACSQWSVCMSASGCRAVEQALLLANATPWVYA
jgi:hypothetical protein